MASRNFFVWSTKLTFKDVIISFPSFFSLFQIFFLLLWGIMIIAILKKNSRRKWFIWNTYMSGFQRDIRHLFGRWSHIPWASVEIGKWNFWSRNLIVFLKSYYIWFFCLDYINATVSPTSDFGQCYCIAISGRQYFLICRSLRLCRSAPRAVYVEYPLSYFFPPRKITIFSLQPSRL